MIVPIIPHNKTNLIPRYIIWPHGYSYAFDRGIVFGTGESLAVGRPPYPRTVRPRNCDCLPAYRPTTGHFAAKHKSFGKDFSYSRMSWVKPNFLWMMYRSGWGIKDNQEVTLALRISRAFFDSLLADAVPSFWDRDRFGTEAD